jgi:lysophospholipase L1-like esterase
MMHGMVEVKKITSTVFDFIFAMETPKHLSNPNGITFPSSGWTGALHSESNTTDIDNAYTDSSTGTRTERTFNSERIVIQEKENELPDEEQEQQQQQEQSKLSPVSIDTFENEIIMPSSSPSLPRRLHDRRGLDHLININIALFIVCFMILNLYSWKIGLGCMIFFALSLHTLDAVSSPPSANPKRFMLFARRVGRNRPVLLCLGDSLTHGKCSASFTHRIPKVVCTKLGIPMPRPTIINTAATANSVLNTADSTFVDPIWVVNAGQNSITSYTVLEERLDMILQSCSQPDFVLLMIGTNDARALLYPSWARDVIRVNRLPQVPSLTNFANNLRGILDKLEQHSPTTQIAIATLPPMGENLQTRANSLIQEMNEVITSVVAEHPQRCTVLPVFARLVDAIERQSHGRSVPIRAWLPVCIVQNLLYQNLYPAVNWNRLSKPLGHVVLSDGLHLNETGAKLVADVVAEWLLHNGLQRNR